MSPFEIIEKYCTDEELRRILVIHSESVMRKALTVVACHPELNIDEQFVCEAAMLHDIGIVKCDAPSIHCFGSMPYICHGHIGAEMLRCEGLPRHANVCERHTGAGLTKEQIAEKNIPLPLQDFLPVTVEEKLICYADKFYSKSHLERERTVEQVVESLRKYGEDGVKRFLEWHEMFQCC